jgi:predicted RNA binding protein YcfA (HicA-like mRNA interferase family)
MKNRDLILKLKKNGCVFLRHGGSHDWYHNPKTNACQPIPRHREINERLARKIIKFLS